MQVRKVEVSLTNKGFRENPGDHIFLIYHDLDDRQTGIRTKLSRGSKPKDLSPAMQSTMARDVNAGAGSTSYVSISMRSSISPSRQQSHELVLVPALQRRSHQVLRHSLHLREPHCQGSRHGNATGLEHLERTRALCLRPALGMPPFPSHGVALPALAATRTDRYPAPCPPPRPANAPPDSAPRRFPPTTPAVTTVAIDFLRTEREYRAIRDRSRSLSAVDARGMRAEPCPAHGVDPEAALQV